MRLPFPIYRIFFCFATLLIYNTSTAQNKSKEIDHLIQQYVDNDLFNGNVLIVQNDKTVFEKSYGLANKEWNIASHADTKFRIGSITKQFTAVLIMQLKEGGRLKIDEKITAYLPWYPKETGDKITVHHLLTHTSGLPNYTDNADAVNDLNTHQYLPEEIGKKYCTGALESEPGKKFKYCNTGYFLLGLIIEHLTHETFAEVLQQRILSPLGMKATGMDAPEQLVVNRAQGYGFSFGGYHNADYINPARTTYAAGGLYSTTHDLYLWQKALHDGRLLSKENLELMLTPNLGNYGYGLYIVKTPADTIIGHNGGSAVFHQACYVFLKIRLWRYSLIIPELINAVIWRTLPLV